MRWDALFDDLEAQLAAQEALDRASEIAEGLRAERGRIDLAQRLLAHQGRRLMVHLGSGQLDGVLADVAPGWLVIGAEGAHYLVPLAAVGWIEGLGRDAAAPPGRVLRGLGLGHALRALARDRAPVMVQLRTAALHGTIDRVGADHVDLALHEPGQWRRAGSVRSVASVPFAGMDWVRSAGGR